MQQSRGSAAERLDRALDAVLDGVTPSLAAAAAGIGPHGRRLVVLGDGVRAALADPPVAPRFEARLGARLAAAVAHRDPVGWALRHPGRLIVTGAVGSAVGVGVTAYAVWLRGSRRSAGHRLLQR